MTKLKPATIARNLMGQVVLVTHHFARRYRHDAREWRASPLSEHRPAWVVGFRRLQNGTYTYGDWETPGRLNVTSTVPAIMVAFWPTEKPVPIPMDGHEGPTEMKPWCSSWGNTTYERERNSREMRRSIESGEIPMRGGRFV